MILHKRFILTLTSVNLFLNNSATTVMHKFSATSQATSPRRNTRRQSNDDYLVLQTGCSEVTRDQNSSDTSRLEEINQDVFKKLYVFYQFDTPHTMLSTVSFGIFGSSSHM